MPTTKSGIQTPADPPNKPLSAPTKIYPGSKSIGQGGGHPSVASPCKDYGRGKKK